MQMILWAIFAVVMLTFLVVDLGWLNRKTHVISTKSATLQSLFWVAISLAYAGCVWAMLGHSMAADFVSAYLTEKMLSVDNLFVILLIFTYFKVKDEYRHKVLYWGILGAFLFRGLFIGAGSLVIGKFHWILYFFGAFLVYSGFKLLFKGDDDEGINIEENKVYRLATRYLPISTGEHGSAFSIIENGKRLFTWLFIVLLIVETTDIIFAFDSIPAVFSITQSPLIVFTSNIFAVMGLRALFFLVENLMKRLQYLQQGLSFVLVFIGGKMLAGILDIHVSSVVSLGVVLATLAVSTLASLFYGRQEKEIVEV